MRKILILFCLLLILLTIVIVTTNKNKNKSSKVTSSQRFGLLPSLGSETFADINERIKMTLPLVLKNTIMSLKPLKTTNFNNEHNSDLNIDPLDVANKSLNPSDYLMYGPAIGNNTSFVPVSTIDYSTDQRFIYFIIIDNGYHKIVEYDTINKNVSGNFYKSSSLHISGDWVNYNSTTNYKVKRKNVNYYPSVIREGLFYIKMKGTNKYIWKNETGGLELIDSPPNFEEFSSKYISGTVKTEEKQPMPFFLKYKEKDEIKREYTFYVKSFLGNIGSENSFKNIGINPFKNAGHGVAKFDYGCSENSGEGGFTMSIPVGQTELYYNARNGQFRNIVSWYYLHPGLKGTIWYTLHLPFGDLYTMELEIINGSMCYNHDYNILYNDRADTIKIEYKEPDRPTLSIMDTTTDDSSCEFKFIYDENNDLYIKKDGKYIHFWYSQFPVLVDGYQNRHAIELVPVLPSDFEDDLSKPKLARRYYNASIEFFKGALNAQNPDGTAKTAINNFCGNEDIFRDGIRKIYDNATNSISEDIVERAFGSICDCNMNQSFYTARICPEERIRTEYGLTNLYNTNRREYEDKLNIIRDTLKCRAPNCSAAKCRKWGLNNDTDTSGKYKYVASVETNAQNCGSSVLCITNQNLTVGAGAIVEGNVLNFDTSTKCGGDLSLIPSYEETGNFRPNGKVLKRNLICKINNQVIRPEENPDCKTDIVYFDFKPNACKIITDNGNTKRITVKNVSSDKTGDQMNWNDVKRDSMSFFKDNILNLPNCS